MGKSYWTTRRVRAGWLLCFLLLGLPAVVMAQADTQAPTAPSGLTNTVTALQVVLNWNASTDNVGVTGYVIGRCGGVLCSDFGAIATTTGTTYTDNAVIAGFHYAYIVLARDSVPNYSGPSNVSSAIPSDEIVDDTEAPTVPSAVTATAASSSQINLSWTASTDNVRLIGYWVERCQGIGCSNFDPISLSLAVTTYSDTGLATSTSYSYRVRAHDAIPNWSDYSSAATATTAPDTQAPTTPTGFTATAATSMQINLRWNAATDNVAVTDYLVERCEGAGCSTFSQIGTLTGGTFYIDNNGLTATTSYSYRVRARDAVPNYSTFSSTATATTLAVHDTQAPTVPTGLNITAAANQLTLTWIASTDNVAVVEYLIERCQGASCSAFAQIDSTTVTTYTDTTAIAGQSYSYRVRARDAIPNYSGYSTTGIATPADCD